LGSLKISGKVIGVMFSFFSEAIPITVPFGMESLLNIYKTRSGNHHGSYHLLPLLPILPFISNENSLTSFSKPMGVMEILFLSAFLLVQDTR
jgi:hypothetical protein